jgi:tRNA-specific adenosine deaminase 3
METSEIRKFMLETISAQNPCDPLDLPITATLVNPETSEVLLTAHDTRVSSRHPLNHAIMNLLNTLPSLSQTTPITQDEQYYASMYDVYTTHEPCVMCCMALIHSRIRRLVFWGGMRTGASEIGWMKGDDEEGTLNHRYMCFEGIEGGLGPGIGVKELDSDIYA